MLLLEKQKHITTLDFDKDTKIDDVTVQINHNGRIIFYAERYPSMNRYIISVDKDHEYSSQRRLHHLSRRFNIEFCEEDLYNDGFYLACCKEYDNSVRLMHTHRDYFKAYLDWFIEKGTVRFYDIHVVQYRG